MMKLDILSLDIK